MAEAVFDSVSFMEPRIFGLPVDRETLFSNHKNVYKKRVEKRQRKLIVKTSFLKPFLRKGEQILLVTTGYSPLNSPAQYFTGFLFIYLKRSLFVFTNYRILHIPTTSTYNYQNSIAQVAYAGCQSIVLKGANLIVQYVGASKKTEIFKGIAVSERKKIRSLLQKKIPLSGTQGHLSARIHLCPRCTRTLALIKNKCKKCRLPFKSTFISVLSAMFIPGGGYFYVRQPLIGCLNAILELALIGLLVNLIFEWRQNILIEPIQLLPIAAFIYVKIASIIHSNHFIKEFIPKEKTIQNRNAS